MKLFQNPFENQEDADAIAAHREQMLLPLCIVGVCCFVPFFIFDFFRGNYVLSAAILGLTLVFVVNGLAIRRRRKVPIPFVILIVPAAISIALSIIYQGAFGTYWSYPLLVFFYFVLSRRAANLCAALLLVAVTLIVYKYIGSDVTIRFAASLALLIVMTNIIVGAIDNLHRQLLEQAIKDPLTGAFNRRYMVTRLTEAAAQKQRNHTIASVLALDIDFFKRINDELGHAAGDAVLIGIVEIIVGRVRLSDKLFRVGGEEFLLFLPETNETNAVIVAEHLRVLISEADLLADRKITVSVGISELRASEPLEAWIKSADDALYKAKETGRNRVVCRPPAEPTGEEIIVSEKL